MKHLDTVSARRIEAIGVGDALPQLANGLIVKERQLEIATQFVALLNEVSTLVKAATGQSGGGDA